MKVRIGVEIHVRLLTKSKLFCSCSTDYEGKEPNTNVCPTCLGFPGSKPRVNKKAIELGILVARALNCKLAPTIFFSRKSYFYPDLPKNFQISQYEVPLATHGWLEVNGKKIRIRRIHLEEDPAKLVYVGGSITSAQHVLVDYNRSGIPLVEVVTEPDFESGEEVREFLSKLSSILEHLEVYDPSKEASLRVDSNVSVEGGERVEIKNITGFANVEKALNFEILRQQNLLRMGLKVERETRHFDEATRTTHTLRKKEFEEDYGYIFEPDLTQIELSPEWVSRVLEEMPELPEQRVERLVKQYKLPQQQACVLVYVDKTLADFFEECAKLLKDPKFLARWIVTDLLKCLNYKGISIRESKVKPQTFVELLELIKQGKITERYAKELIKEFVATGKSPRKLVEERGVKILKKEEELEKVVRDVLREEKKAVEDLLKGKKEAIQFLIGKVLKRTGGVADPKIVKGLLEKILLK